ncbi:hypothetical protein UB31_11850 [Bradyrhizobium sp. LTSP849]|nr:hypothetical protein UP06_26435 [Bradyrhizobium sp. LTSP857]KJC50563.1 hypothetical protein UB31_11850 [Bradyrhizobium sp. LTSP849]
MRAEAGKPTSEVAADFTDAATEPPAQQRAQSHAFSLANFSGDLVDAGVAGLEQMHGALMRQNL